MSRVLFLALLLSVTVALADLHDPANRADYMIVTTTDLIQNNAWITQLSDWRAQHGRVSMVVPTEQIWNEFGTGIPSDTVLKEFLHYARRNWQPPQLRDVFIIGFHDVVPSHMEPDSQYFVGDSSYHRFTYFSDFFFSADPDSVNPVPVLGVGRLPWSPTFLPVLPDHYAKILAYEQATPEAWQTRVHLVADRSDGTFNFWQDYSEPLAAEVPEGYLIERDYLDFPVGNPWHGDREEFLSNLEAGSFMLSYMGHGGAGVWSGSLLLV